MVTSKVAKRYAQGLLDFTLETNSVDTVVGEMGDVVKLLNESKDLTAFLGTPFVETKKKLAAAKQIFTSFSQPSQNFIALVIKQGRESQLRAIAKAFVQKVEDLRGVQRVSLTTAAPLSQQVISDILKSTTLLDYTKQYDLESNVNPQILGGYILRVGDQQVDTSVRTKLNQLKKGFQLN